MNYFKFVTVINFLLFADNNTSVAAHALLINVELQILNMALKSVKCEHTGEEFWVLVSTIINDSTK